MGRTPRGRPRAALLALGVACAVARPALAANRIVTENLLPGNPPSEWDVVGSSPGIDGFATEISVAPGEPIDFKVKTAATDYRIDIYRMGYYGGMGARLVATVEPSVPLPQTQPANPLWDPVTALKDCGNWAVSASWTVPADAVSGIYFAKLVREDPEDGRAQHVVFVVRDDGGRSDLLVQTSDATWQAYNQWGGNSLYVGVADDNPPRAYKVSYNRPVTLRWTEPWDYVFSAEYPMVRWLERNGYDVSYITEVDCARRGEELREHLAYLSVGHDEYWSLAHREAVEAARDAGVHLAFFSGNEIYWKVRWEPGVDASAAPYRTLVCYKETFANAKIDPLPLVWTGKWADCRFSPPADGCRPENLLSGQLSWTNARCNGFACGIDVPASRAAMRLWRNTAVADLQPGEVYTTPAGTLGYEWDVEKTGELAAYYPAGRVTLSETTVGTEVHRMSLYRHPSGALVFGAGTVQWSWGLDDHHTEGPFLPTPGEPPDAAMQQFTANLLAEFGAIPETLQSGLVPPESTGDSTSPVSAITSPPDGTTTLSGPVVVAGTAHDDAGAVMRVEVSVDGGSTWEEAAGTTDWTFSWVAPPGAGLQRILSRAVDDLGNLETPGAGVTLSVDPPSVPRLAVAPNPFTPSTTISYDLAAATRVRLTVHSVTGRRVRTLVNGPRWAGRYAEDWDGRDDSGSLVASGVYLLHLESGGSRLSGSVVVVR